MKMLHHLQLHVESDTLSVEENRRDSTEENESEVRFCLKGGLVCNYHNVTKIAKLLLLNY